MEIAPFFANGPLGHALIKPGHKLLHREVEQSWPIIHAATRSQTTFCSADFTHHSQRTPRNSNFHNHSNFLPGLVQPSILAVLFLIIYSTSHTHIPTLNTHHHRHQPILSSFPHSDRRPSPSHPLRSSFCRLSLDRSFRHFSQTRPDFHF